MTSNPSADTGSPTMQSEQTRRLPLYVDLDGTLIYTDMLFESVLQLLKKNPLYLIACLFWVLGGRAKLKAEAVKPAPMVAVPLSAVHLPPAPGAAQSVSLLTIGDLQNVNRLPTGANLPFGDGNGLTVVYGENGAGKSSYARVIKKACRARGMPPNIVSNAFAP